MRLMVIALGGLLAALLSNCASHSSISKLSRLARSDTPFWLLISGGILMPISPRSILLMPFCELRINFAPMALPKLTLMLSCVSLMGFFSINKGVASAVAFPNGAGSCELKPTKLERMLTSDCLLAICALADQSALPASVLGTKLANDFLRPASVTRP